MSQIARYALAEVGGGALMLDLLSGRTFALNESGTFIWRSWLSGRNAGEIAVALASHYGLSAEHAKVDVDGALEVATQVDSRAARTDLHYARVDDQYVFWLRDARMLVVDGAGGYVTVGDHVADEKIPWLLQALSPKILALRGHTVLHAAAVELNGSVIAISGESGAGKTTTAHALADAGATLVAEDKLPILISGSQIGVSLVGERVIADWVSSAARELRQSHRADCSLLDRAFAERIVPLAEIGFIDIEHRTVTGGHLAQRLDPVAAAGEIFRGCFYGSDLAEHWNRHLRSAALIAETTSAFELKLPSGLDRLAGTAAQIVSGGSVRP
jgi:hypothetical protein